MAVDRVLRNQVRGITGAFIVTGVTILLAAEMWRLAWGRPASHLIIYSAVGLGVVLLTTRSSGFRVEEEVDAQDESQYQPLRLGVDFTELTFQSLVAALVVLFMYGIVNVSTPTHVIARMALLQVVPLGFGAAVANRLLQETENQRAGTDKRRTLSENMAVFAVGAIFFSLPLGASVEINILAALVGWRRLALIIAVSLLTAYLILYELEFRGQSRRTVNRERGALIHAGQVCIVYAVGFTVAALLLWGFGYLTYSVAADIQKILVLTFPTTVGGAAARVIL